jgi:hypothetical protein
MSNYVKSTDFQAKDSLLTGDPNKIIKGAEINDEFNAIQTAVATKADISSPTFLGNPTAPTQATDNNSTRLANTAFVHNQIASDATNVAITGGTIDGVAITGGTITGLATDLAVADGGTGSSTLATNAVLLGNGTSALQTVAPSTSGNVLTSNGTTWVSSENARLGVGQSWQNVLGSRSSGVTYTNSTGKPIVVMVHTNSVTGTPPTVTASVSGVLLVNYTTTNPLNLYPAWHFSLIVPNGATYVVNLGANTTFNIWAELR